MLHRPASPLTRSPFQPLWFRGRVFYDNLNNNFYDVGTDTPLANKDVEIGRFIGEADLLRIGGVLNNVSLSEGTSFVSLGSATSIADGTFNVYFSAGAGGNFSIGTIDPPEPWISASNN